MPRNNPYGRKNDKKVKLTAVIVLHDINLSLYYSGDFAAMKDDRIIYCGKPEEVITAELVHKACGVKFKIESMDGKPAAIPM